GAGSTFTVPVTRTYSQSGTVDILPSGTMSVAGSFANFSAGVLAGGTYQIQGTFQYANAAISSIAATIILDGAAASINDLFGSDALANLASIQSSGSLTIQNGRNFTTVGAFNVSGSLAVGVNSAFTVSGLLTQSGSISVQAGASLSLLGGGNASGTLSVDGIL